MNRHRRRHIPSKLIIIVLFLIFGMGIGYAAISTTLEIDGTSDIDSASWNVHFANVQVTTGSVAAATPSISNNTNVSFSANLANPGDFYEFKVDVINEGTLDAKLDDIEVLPVLTQTQQNYFKYIVTYADGVPIEENDALNVGVTETLLIKVEYLTQTDTSLYPTDDVSFDFSVSMTYVQGHGNRKIFSVSDVVITTGQQLPTGVQTFNSYQAAINSYGKDFFIEHKVNNNNVVVSSLVGFVRNSKVYYLKTASDNRYFESNTKVLTEAFGTGYCNCQSTFTFCNDGTIMAEADTAGYTFAKDNTINCHGENDGRHSCVVPYNG